MHLSGAEVKASHLTGTSVNVVCMLAAGLLTRLSQEEGSG
jgi:hypothetical protein